jgi:hypothetical protein
VDERTAQQIQTDPYYLVGALVGDSSDASKRILEAIDQGTPLSFEVSPNLAKGGYDIEILLKSSSAASS